MNQKQKCLLTVNAGSSSVKLALVRTADSGSADIIWRLVANGIGQGEIKLVVKSDIAPQYEQTVQGSDMEAVARAVLQTFNEVRANVQVYAVGHRIVHGGDKHEPVIIDEAVLQQLEEFAQFDPEHMPASLSLVRQLQQHITDVPHIACFDTAFFAELPEVAHTLPLPQKYRDLGVRRYGFHGLSYAYLSRRLVEVAGKDVAHGRVIMAHLGSGASVTALLHGKPVDTTMSFTPASGIVMSSRSGDLDPGIALFLQQRAGLSLEAFTHMVNHESGLLGISDATPDMKSLIDASSHDHKAALAIEIFCYRVRQAIGALSASLGGIDALVFSGGIGEQSATIRRQITKDLAYLGIQLDADRNQTSGEDITGPYSRVRVYVLPTDESMSIAHEVLQLMEGK